MHEQKIQRLTTGPELSFAFSPKTGAASNEEVVRGASLVGSTAKKWAGVLLWCNLVMLIRTSWIRTSLLAAIAIVVTFIYLSGEREAYWHLQTSTFIWLNHMLNIIPQDFWFGITQLGDALILFPFFFYLIVKRPQSFAALVTTIPFACVLSVVGKAVAATPRPATVLDVTQFEIAGSMLTAHTSFPSGHTLTAFAAAGALLFSLPSLKRNWREALAVSSLALLVGLSRVAVGAHWPLDVVGGAVCGLLAGFIGAKCVAGRSFWHCIYSQRCVFWVSFTMLAWSLYLFSEVSPKDPLMLIYVFASASGILASLHFFIRHHEHARMFNPRITGPIDVTSSEKVGS